MNLKLLDSFPAGYQPNEAQKYILSELSKALDMGHKYIIIQAPTASGKSFISKTLANYSYDASEDYVKLVQSRRIFDPSCSYNQFERDSWGTAILTCTKTLQDQYAASFPDGSVAKGKTNYACAISQELDCENGYCRVQPKQAETCKKNLLCPYQIALLEALCNKCAFYSYSMFGALYHKVKRRQFLVCDEASELEAEIVSEFTGTIKFKQLEKLIGVFPSTPLGLEERDDWWRWLSSVSARVESEYGNAMLEQKKYTKKDVPAKLRAKIYQLEMMQNEIKKPVENWDATHYIIVRENDGITFVPFEINSLAKQFFNFGETVILMSATIVDHARYARTLGIHDYYYIEAPCTLDPKKGPIVCSQDTRISYKTRFQVLPQIVNKIKEICTRHEKNKGLIHTHTMEILKYIQDSLFKDKRFLFRDKGVVNESLLKTHTESSDATVMVSPSMTHGIDLKGKLGEFQVIVKAPYPPLGDPRVKKKFEADPQWYMNQMLSTLIQASGRCNRVQEDEAITYILDANATDAIIKNKDKLPKYFLERII